MNCRLLTIALLLTFQRQASWAFAVAPGVSEAWHDSSPHRSRMLTVDKDVQLEVLDWGGLGRPLVFLSGLGNTAHIWDNFAPRFTDKHRVIAITRRGFGRSTHTGTGYSPERLADDILAVITELRLDRPVLVGHSIAGEELSSIGVSHPMSVSALIYLDAAYSYAFYDAAGDYESSVKNLAERVNALAEAPQGVKLMHQVQNALPQFSDNLYRKLNSRENPMPSFFGSPTAADKASFAAMTKRLAVATGGIPPEAEPRESFLAMPDGSVGDLNASPEAGSSMMKSTEHYTAAIQLPILAIMGLPQSRGPNFQANTPKNIAAAAAADDDQARQINAFEHGQPNARVVRIPGANHYIFISNEQQVYEEINRFTKALP